MFSDIKNKHDIEEYEVLLADEELRKRFYDHLSKLGRNLTYAVESEEIYHAIGVEKLKRYKKEFRFFQELRRNVKIRYFEAIDHREYELKMQKLMDNYIASEEIIRITNPVDITDEDAFSKELERLSSPRAQAEAIQTRLSKAISKQMSRNPAYYKKFSVRIQETIKMYRKHRITEVDFLAQMKQVLHDYREGNSGIEYPERITDNDHAKAFYGELDDLFSEVQFPDSIDKYQLTNDIAELAIETEEIINTNVKVDWTDNPEIHKKIEQKLDDMLYDFFDKHDIEINFEMIDKMIESLKMIALRRFNK
jgi:type I restriction enzyme R subunit